MATLRKDVIKPGVYRKGNRVWSVNSNEVQTMSSSVPEVQALGYRIPVWMEHAPIHDPKEAWRSLPIPENRVPVIEKDPWFAGWVKSSVMGSDGTLSLDFDTDDLLAERLKETGTFVSPQYGQFQVGTKLFPNAIHHLALTRNPVNKDQTNQFTVPNSENLENPIDQNLESGQGIRQMSLTEALASGDVIRFSMNDAVTPSSQQTPQGQPNGMPQQPNPHDDATQRFIEALAALGISIDPSSPIQGDPRTLGQLTSMLAGMTTDAADRQAQQQAATNPNGGASGSGYQQQATVVAMSTNAPEMTQNPPAAPIVNQPAAPAFDPERVTQMSQALVLQDGKIKAQEAQIAGLMGLVTSQTRQKYLDRVGALQHSGRITAEQATSLSTLATAYQFSASSPDSKTELDIRLEVYEGLPANAVLPMQAGMPTQMSQYTQTPVSQTSQFFADPEPTDEKANEILAKMFPKA